MTPPHFCHSKINKGGPLRNAKHDKIATGKQTIKYDKNPTVKHVKFFTEEQAEFICKRVNARKEHKYKNNSARNEFRKFDRNKYLQKGYLR